MNSALIKSLGSRWPNNVDSDDSEDDDVFATGRMLDTTG